MSARPVPAPTPPSRRRKSEKAKHYRFYNNARDPHRRLALASWAGWELTGCIHCGERVRTLVVIAPKGRGVPVKLHVSARPSPDGRVYQNREGEWRLLPIGAPRFTGPKFYGVHGYAACSDEARWLGDVRSIVELAVWGALT